MFVTSFLRCLETVRSAGTRGPAFLNPGVVRSVPWKRKFHLLVGIAAATLLVVGTYSSTVTTQGTAWYVSPDGSPSNPGTADAPLDLATALSGNGPAQPGDTIWLRGGTYHGSFVSHLQGTESAPIVVRQYPGERATIDSAPSNAPALHVYGANTWYWGFEIRSSGVKRKSITAGWPGDLDRGEGIVNQGPNCKFINLVIHDTTQGIGMWGNTSPDSEIYGSLIYYNGWELISTGSGYSHGIYTQSSAGRSRTLRDNIVFSNYQQGIHVFDQVSDGGMDNVTLEGNVAFVNGQLKSNINYNDNIHVGAYDAASAQLRNFVARNNMTYFPTNDRAGKGIDIGGERGGSGEVSGNYAAGGEYGGLLFGWDLFDPTTCSDNTVWSGPSSYVMAKCPESSNTYHGATKPTATRVFVRPNAYEAGRSNVVIYNWELRSAVPVSLAGTGLAAGDGYEVRDAWNFYGAPVVAGTYTGEPISIPMNGLTVAPPAGHDVSRMPAHTAPEFGVFIVLKTNAPPTNTPQTEVCGDGKDNDADGQVDEDCAVDCVVSEWSDWQPTGEWSACTAGVQSRTEQRTRSILTDSANGGAACPALQETRTATQSCATAPPPEVCGDNIDNDLDGQVDEDCAPPSSQLPGAPTTLVAKVSGSMVRLSWVPPSGDVPVTGYVVEAGVTPGTTSYVVPVGARRTTLRIRGVATGRYYVRVRAGNQSGLGPASNEIVVSVGCSATVDGSLNTFSWTDADGCTSTSH